MSSQALYRKYRSKSLKEVVGQGHIVEVLTNALKQDKISHAYLFTGPRGVGKTSIARIFAHEINKAEYTSEKTHLDIIEIDAASNSGVDDMRELREKINSAPLALKYKIYIIDEVHMLSGASFAALLKTIEEPPSHAIFILATTDAHKVPATIMSRVQKFYFKPIEQAEIVKHLQSICKKEDIKFDKDSLEAIAESSEGSMRDALSLLDQVSSGKKTITLSDVHRSLGLSDNKNLESLCSLVDTGQLDSIPEVLSKLIQSGAEPKSLSIQLYNILKSKQNSYKELRELSELLTIGSLTKPALGLEISLLKLASLKSNKDHPEEKKTDKPALAAIVETESTTKDKITVSNKEIKEIAKKERLTRRNLSEKWGDILDIIAKKSPGLKAVLKPSTQNLTEKNYTLSLNLIYPVHLKIFSESKNKQIFKDAFASLSLELPTLDIGVASKPAKGQSETRSEDNNTTGNRGDLSDIIGLMGGGETVEI